MMRMAVIAASVFVLAGGVRQPAKSQFSAAGIDDPEIAFTFVSDLQKAVAADDAARVARLGQFPLDVVIRKQRRRVRSSAEFTTL
jgi:hypothetical protein